LISINREPLLLIIISAWVIYRILAVRQNGGINFLREVLLNLFLVYTLVVFSYTFFPINIPLFRIDFHNANLIPFDQTIRYLRQLSEPTAIRNLAGNLFLLMPLGIFLPVLFLRMQNFWRVSAIGLLITLIIETFQMFLLVRVFDIDDIILNAFGVMVGYAAIKLLKFVPLIKTGVRRTAIMGKRQSNWLFIGFVAAVFLGFSLLTTGAVFQGSQSIDQIENIFAADESQRIHTEKLDHFALVLVEAPDGTDSLYLYQKVILNRYLQIDWIDNLDLEEKEFRLVESPQIDWKADNIAIARSSKPLESMRFGGVLYPMVSIGDYHFAYVRADSKDELLQADSIQFYLTGGEALELIRRTN